MKFCNTRHVHESTKSQAWRAFLFTCFACLHTCVLTCLTSFPAHALICLVHSRVYMLVCLCVYVIMCLACLLAPYPYVLKMSYMLSIICYLMYLCACMLCALVCHICFTFQKLNSENSYVQIFVNT